jgi:CheY-like chemotaxis protein
MKQIYILCVDDELDVLQAVARDLASAEELFPVETAASAAEAKQIVERIKRTKGAALGLIFCDHIMPGQNGVDFLIELAEDPATCRTRKVLFTGQAGLEDTVQAINRAGIQHYLAKPWQKENLLAVTRDLLTDYVIEQDLDPLPFMRFLDAVRLAEFLHQRNRLHGMAE